MISEKKPTKFNKPAFFEKKKQSRTPEKKKTEFVQKNKPELEGNIKLPSRLERLIEQYIENKTGKSLDTPITLERIRQSVLAQKAGYWNKNPQGKYGKGYDVFAYLAYQAPGYIIQFRHILKILGSHKMLPKDVSILDLGTGPGVVPLALIWHLKEKNAGSITINVIEQSEEFIEAFKYLIPEFASSSPVKTGLILHEDLRNSDHDIPDNLTLITCQNVMAELPGMSIDEKTSLLMKYVSHLSDDGFLILVEPAELRHATQLRILQKKLEASGLFLYAPCRYLHEGQCNPETCWSFIELSLMKSTRLMDLLAGEKEGYRFRNTDIKFSYSILTKKPRIKPIPSHVLRDTVPLCALQDNLGEWVSIAGAKMSMDIGDKEFAVYMICDGSTAEKVYLIIPRSLRTEEIKTARTAKYGDLIKIYDVRVRWNPKKNSYNLISGMRTRVIAMNI